MKKLTTLLLALVTCAGTMFASDTQVDGIWYNFNDGNLTAEVTYQGAESFSYSNEYSGEVVIPSSVTYNNKTYTITSIGEWAFSVCSGLTSVTIPNSVTSIGSYAFEGCNRLTSVTIPNSVTFIGDYAFRGCSNLTTIDVATDNPNYCSEDGVLFNRDKTILIQYPEAKQGSNYTIPNSVTSIGDETFRNCSGLTSLTIPNSVTSIGWGAFILCTGLTSVTIPNSVTSIGDHAFNGCSGLTSVEIPNSVTSIGEGAFENCSSLNFVTIPNSVTSIGDRAFYNCRGLTSVTNYATTPQSINSNVFNDVKKSTCVLNVPKESVSLYQAANVWKEFTNIVGVDDYTINYVDKDSQALYNHVVTLYVPVAPAITGFTFIGWDVVAGHLTDGITLQAVYQANTPTNAPAVYTNPANPAQKLIKNGNVYILTDDKTYTITGQQVK